MAKAGRDRATGSWARRTMEEWGAGAGPLPEAAGGGQQESDLGRDGDGEGKDSPKEGQIQRNGDLVRDSAAGVVVDPDIFEK